MHSLLSYWNLRTEILSVRAVMERAYLLKDSLRSSTTVVQRPEYVEMKKKYLWMAASSSPSFPSQDTHLSVLNLIPHGLRKKMISRNFVLYLKYKMTLESKISNRYLGKSATLVQKCRLLAGATAFSKEVSQGDVPSAIATVLPSHCHGQAFTD